MGAGVNFVEDGNPASDTKKEGRMTKRTEGPWVVAEDVFNYRPEIRDRDGRLIAVVMAHYPMSATTQSANAAFIVRACNCHDELVEALKAASVFIRNGIELGFIRMPDKDTPDPAYLVPGMIETALAKTTDRLADDGKGREADHE